MMTITVSELQRGLQHYLSQAQTEPIVIRLDNGKQLRLDNLDSDDAADEALESDPRFDRLMAERRRQYQQVGGVPLSMVRQTLIDELIQDLNADDPQVRHEAAEQLVELLGARAAAIH